MALPPMSKRDSEQVLRYAFDDNTGRLRVDAVVSVAPGGISAADGDNIAISDGVDTVVVNPDGSINTNSTITGDVTVELSAADGDNVAISDGTDTLAINPDGSINITDNGSSITVDAVNLDIRDLSATQDNVAVSDGVDTMAVNADGSINVNVTAGSLAIEIDAADGDNIAIADATTGDTLVVNPDGSINVSGSFSAGDIFRLVPFEIDDVEIISKNANSEPLVVEYRKSAALVATLTLIYDIDGDFQRVTRS